MDGQQECILRVIKSNRSAPREPTGNAHDTIGGKRPSRLRTEQRVCLPACLVAFRIIRNHSTNNTDLCSWVATSS